MSHLYKQTEWKDSCDYWHCNDVEDLANGSGYWWHPARMLGLTPAAYVKMVVENFKPDSVCHNEDCSFVGWSWKSQVQMRKYKNWVNAEARKRNFIV